MPGISNNRNTLWIKFAMAFIFGLLFTGYMSIQSIKLAYRGVSQETRVESISERRHKGRLLGYSVSYYVQVKKNRRPILGYTVIPTEHRDRFKEGQEVAVVFLSGLHPVTYLKDYTPGKKPMLYFLALVVLGLGGVVWFARADLRPHVFND
jgi:hypothetical protein